MKKPEINNVEVDMVPLIDIISLLLMFLIIVGDTTASSNIASLRLPVVSNAQTDTKSWGVGRFVIQLKPEFDDDTEQVAKNGKYFAVFNGSRHANDADGKALKNHLARCIDEAAAHETAHRRRDGSWDIPVKLRIPALCPMVEAEKILNTVASLQLTDIQYAASAKSEANR